MNKMKIEIGTHVRTRVSTPYAAPWALATIGDIVTGHKGTVQYRVDYENEGYFYLEDFELEIVKYVPGVGWLSIPACDELEKLVDGVNHDAYLFSHWDFNQYFIPSLVSHLHKIGREEDAAKVRHEAMNMVWSFENGRLQCVQHADEDVKPGVYFSDGQEFHGEAGWETIRDLCIPVVMQYR